MKDETSNMAKSVTLADLLKYWKILSQRLMDESKDEPATYHYCEGIEFCIMSLQDWLKLRDSRGKGYNR